MDKQVWVQHPELVWVAAHLPAASSSSSSTAQVVTIHGDTLTLPYKSVIPSNTLDFNALVDNLVDLEELNEPAILHQIRSRYEHNTIYSWIGSILVALNPFKTLPIYTAQIMEEFIANNNVEHKPHIFAIAAQAFRAATTGMLNGIPVSSPNQAFIISGESGSGKTESTKLILQYISEASGGLGSASSGMHSYILSVNPLLEAFGNAKTVRNDNSSRFGKWMEIHFKKGATVKPKMVGAVIINYLLEKSRVISVGPGERGYHIFYQLCSACAKDPVLNEKYQLDHPSKFNFLNGSNVFSLPHLSDDKEFENTLSAMELIKFTPEEIDGILQIIAAILHAGNIVIKGRETDAGVHAFIENEAQLQKTAAILEVPVEILKRVILSKEFGIGSLALINLRPEEAIAMRNSLCTGLYAKLFDWLVHKANKQLASSELSSEKTQKDMYIGVLDIFGFEIFENNSFEQFCINFANEKLQQHFTSYILDMEQKEYMDEGINFASIAYEDNKDCIELIEGKLGILQYIEEEGVIPKGTNASLLKKLDDTFTNSRFEVSKKIALGFTIRHYAGTVLYNVDSFIQKNKDTFQSSLLMCLLESNICIMKLIFEEEIASTSENLDESRGTRPRFRESISPAKMPNKKGTSAKIRSVGTLFKNQMSLLMANLQSAHPYFVRCIKPNMSKTPNCLESLFVLKQMQYSGLFEAISIRAKGFPVRLSHENFVKYYSICLSKAERKEIPKEPRKGVAFILKWLFQKALTLKLTVLESDFPIGNSKIFMKVTAQNAINSIRDASLWTYVIKMQAMIKGYLVRKSMRKRKLLIERAKTIIQNRNAKAADVEKILNDDEDLDLGIGKDLIKKVEDFLQFIGFRDNVEGVMKKAIEERKIQDLKACIEDSTDYKFTDSELLKLVEKAKLLVAELSIETPNVPEEEPEVAVGPDAEYTFLLSRKQALEKRLDELDEEMSSIKSKIVQIDQSMLKLSAGINVFSIPAPRKRSLQTQTPRRRSLQGQNTPPLQPRPNIIPLSNASSNAAADTEIASNSDFIPVPPPAPPVHNLTSANKAVSLLVEDLNENSSSNVPPPAPPVSPGRDSHHHPSNQNKSKASPIQTPAKPTPTLNSQQKDNVDNHEEGGDYHELEEGITEDDLFIPNSRDYLLEMQEHQGRYFLYSMSDLRDKENFSKRTFFNKRAELKEHMHVFTREPIPRSLIKYTKADFSESADGIKKWKEIREEGKRLFKNLLNYMGISFHQYPTTCAAEIIHVGLREPLLRDEIFVQLVKQTTDNPDESTSIKVFKLMFLCLRAFAPERTQVHLVLRTHLAARASRTMNSFVGFSSISGVAGHCWEALDCAMKGELIGNIPMETIEGVLNMSSCYMSIQVGSGLVNCEIPDVPPHIRYIFPFESLSGPIRAQDLTEEICMLAGLNIRAVLQCENPPAQIEPYLIGDFIMPPKAILADVLYEVRDRCAGMRWKLVRIDQAAIH